jgi:bla regulator protein blaR1
MTVALLSDVANHVWQSTLFLAGACGLAWLLRRNSAEARFRIWLAASLKFLVPFAPLIAFGRAIGWPSPTTMPQPMLSTALNTLNQPFVRPSTIVSQMPATPVATVAGPSWPEVLAAIWLTGCAFVLVVWTIRWFRVAAIVRASSPLTDVDLIARLRRAERAMGVRRPLRAVVSDAEIEPGVFGIMRPVLVWPRELADHLQGHQIDGVLIHEVAHVRRRDNLTAVLHLVVETVFWFVPPVWWLGGQLVRERELACDRAAVTAGSDPRSYAESILRTCELYAESPLACVSGVTGSDLKKRIAAIVRGHAGDALGLGHRAIIAATASVAIGMPVALGVLQAPMLLAQTVVAAQVPSFEAASVKRNTSGEQRASFGPRGSQLVVVNNNLFNIIRNAWGIQGNQILGGPDWVRSDGERFDITAKVPEGAKPAQMLLMMQALLADRFKLKVHRETREVPVYALVMARPDRKIGPQMAPAAFDCTALRAAIERGERPTPPTPNGDRPACGARTVPGRFLVGGYPIADFARNLSGFLGGRPVIDRTGLTGIYDLELTWTPEAPPAGRDGTPPPGVDPNGPSVFTAVQEQLGLRLEATTGPVEVLVIDSADRPTPD